MNSGDFAPGYNVQTLKTVEKALSGMSTQFGNRFFDNSMLDLYRVCPRKFYFRAIRHWDKDAIKPALTFGSGWHGMQDLLWPNPDATLKDLKNTFLEIWEKDGMGNMEDFDLFPRTPARAFDMIEKYRERYASWLKNIEIVGIERPFIVPLSEEHQNLFYVGKNDKIYKQSSFIYTCDHKTSSSFAATWVNSWSPNGQVDGYLYSGHMEFGEAFKGVIIDGALVQKTKIDFMRIPCERQIDMLDSWKWEVLEQLGWILYYEEMLKDLRSSQKEEPFLKAFPKCTTSCTSYYGACPFLDLCKFISNPELQEEPPASYKVDEWQPFEITENAEGKFEVKELKNT